MPYREKEIKKLYYSIGEVASMFHVKTSHIRFWSKQFSVIKPATNKKGNRQFTAADIENLRIIYHLVKEKGFTLKGAKVEMQAMRKKMRIEQDPEKAKGEVVDNVITEETPFEQPTSIMRNEEDMVDKMAIRNSLQKIRTSLLQLQNELTLMQQ
jgi:DNA-binding transcriptional MerR regulator